jgi:antitoxin VapB
MTLSIKDPEADRLARELATATGESLTTAVATALRERLDRVRGATRGGDLASELTAIAVRCAALPVLDERSDDEILGYDKLGVPA